MQERIGQIVPDIQHIGDTAVSGPDAKPIIDVAVAVTSVGVIPQLRRPLSDLGYIDRGDCRRGWGLPLSEGIRTRRPDSLSARDGRGRPAVAQLPAVRGAYCVDG